MDFMVACNWENDLLDKIDYPEVKTLFGGLSGSIIGSGRSPSTLKNISNEDAREYIKCVHAKGWEFDLNVNTTCMANMEYTKEGYKDILNYIESLIELNIDSLTVSMTSIIKMIKKHFPDTKINVSTFQKVDTVSMAQRFEDLGVDVIMLSENVNRDFKLLSAIRKSVKTKIALIANVGCLYECPDKYSHANSIAHNSSNSCRYSIFSESFQANCLCTKIMNPVEFIKSRWIRPEDVHVYEDIGIDVLKILDRTNTTDILSERVEAYSKRTFEGNIIDMMGQMINPKHSRAGKPPNIQMNMEDAQKLNRLYMTFFKSSVSDYFYLDNKKIPKDFINGFKDRDCSSLSCDKCNYCKSIADACISELDIEAIIGMRKNMNDLKNDIFNGSALI